MGQTASQPQAQQEDECLRTKRAVLSFLYEGAPYRNQDADERWQKRTMAARALIRTGSCCGSNCDELEPMRALLLSQLRPEVAELLQAGLPVASEYEVSRAISVMARQVRRSILQSVPVETAKHWEQIFPFVGAFDMY